MSADCHTQGKARDPRWVLRPDGLQESIWFTPGYNCPRMDMQGHGVHGMEITWLLRGPAGAVQLIFGTDWTPGELRPGHGLRPDGSRGWQRHGSLLWSTDPWGRGIGVHARRPQYDGHEDTRECGLLGGRCYYDEQLSGADKLVAPFMAEGDQVIWDELEARYEQLSRAEWNAQFLERESLADPKPAPELAAAMPETHDLRELVGEILDHFGPSGSGHTARVGKVQIRKWRDRAGLNR